ILHYCDTWRCDREHQAHTCAAPRDGRESPWNDRLRWQDVGYAVGVIQTTQSYMRTSRSVPTHPRYLGLDVYAETIAEAIAELDGTPPPPDPPSCRGRRQAAPEGRPRDHLRGVLRGRALGYVHYRQRVVTCE